MCFPRKPWLGVYSGTRQQWKDAYRSARIKKAEGQHLDGNLSSLEHKGVLILFDRAQKFTTTKQNLVFSKLVQEVLAEEKEPKS